MFDSFLAGGLCGCLLATLTIYYVATRLKRAPQRLATQTTCTRAYPYRAYAVHVRHVSFASPLTDLTQQEKNQLTFLCYLIECGKVSEEV